VKERILVVEDERIIACDIKDYLERSGYIVPAIAAYGKQAIEKAEALQPDLVLMDIMLKGDMNGIEAAEQIFTRFQIPIVYLTAYSDENTLNKAKITQPFGYVLKPFEETQLITTIEIALNRYRNEICMREALAKEKAMHDLKSQFVSIVSHEFRNPLNAIINSTELLAIGDSQLSESQKNKYIHHIQKSVKHMNQLLSDVLLIGKGELGKAQFNPAPLDVEKFCHELIEEIQFTLDTHQIVFTSQGSYLREETINSSLIELPTKLPNLDAKLLRYIISNLLTNALKYSPKDAMVKFDLFCLQEEVILRIKDEGIGIPYADQDELFASFHRACNVGNIPGNGLGLVIVKQYVELHGGEITFASKEGVGTTFIVSIPIN
jgi:signal transduction histidine kinase